MGEKLSNKNQILTENLKTTEKLAEERTQKIEDEMLKQINVTSDMLKKEQEIFMQKFEEKKLLVKKLKKIILYRPLSEGAEFFEVGTPSFSPPLAIDYLWPLNDVCIQ